MLNRKQMGWCLILLVWLKPFTAFYGKAIIPPKTPKPLLLECGNSNNASLDLFVNILCDELMSRLILALGVTHRVHLRLLLRLLSKLRSRQVRSDTDIRAREILRGSSECFAAPWNLLLHCRCLRNLPVIPLLALLRIAATRYKRGRIVRRLNECFGCRGCLN